MNASDCQTDIRGSAAVVNLSTRSSYVHLTSCARPQRAVGPPIQVLSSSCATRNNNCAQFLHCAKANSRAVSLHRLQSFP